MKVFFAADHAGFELKEKLISFVEGLGHEVQDCGAHEFDPQDDYPVFMARAATRVRKDPEHARAILIGGSGQGEAMAANRYAGVRAAVFYGGDDSVVRLSREHNSANALALGSRFLSEEEAKDAVAAWLSIPFSNEERHARRIAQIDALRNE